MKQGLIFSLILNCILGYLYFTQAPKKEVVERVIIETHAQNEGRAPVPVTDTRKVIQPEIPKKKKSGRPVVSTYTPHDMTEYQDMAEKVETDRRDYFIEKLGMSEEMIVQHGRIRNEFMKASTKFWEKNPLRELSLEEKRAMLTLEEEYYGRFERLHGKENWKRYQKFRNDYNQKGLKSEADENRPFVFMGL